MRKPSFALAAAVLVAAIVAAAVQGTPPPVHSTGVEVWGQPDRSAEVAGHPLGTTIALFRSKRLAARLPGPAGLMRPLAVVAAHLRGNPGALLPAGTRRVTAAAGPIYLVPTVRGWVCVQASRFETCHRGLLREGITWTFYSTPAGIDVIGIAADNVAGIALTDAHDRRQAKLEDNVFFVRRPLSLTSAQHLPPLGRLTVSYRDATPQASVALR